MEGCLRGARSRKGALDLAKKGMLRKDNLFEVVRYPGADKRGHLWSGQVSFLVLMQKASMQTVWMHAERDTGGAVPCPGSSKGVSPRKGIGVDAAQLI